MSQGWPEIDLDKYPDVVADDQVYATDEDNIFEFGDDDELRIYYMSEEGVKTLFKVIPLEIE